MKTYTVTATLPSGKRKYYRGKTRKEAEDKRDKDRVALGLGIHLDDTTLFKDFAETWFVIKQDEDLHKKTVDTIRFILDRYIIPCLGKRMVVDLKPYDIRMLMHSVSAYSRSTQAKVLQYTRSILELAVENSLLVQNPALKSIKPGGAKTEEVVPLTDEQCQRLLEATKGTRVWLFLMVLRYAGLRKGEALGLMWSDINFEENTIRIQRSVVYPNNNRDGEINTECKTAAAFRTIPMVSMLSSALKQAKTRSKSMYVFSMRNGKFLSEASFRSMWKLIDYRSECTATDRAFINRTLDFHVYPHQLRHTCATAWIRSGMDPKQVMYLMGHSTMDVTMEIYTHYMEELRREEALSKMELCV